MLVFGIIRCMTTRRTTVGSVQLSALPQHLYSCASRAAHRAVQSSSGNDPYEQAQAALAIGEACEWLLRAAIAEVQPALLADTSRGKDSLMALSGAAPFHLASSALKTINVTEAVTIVKRLHPQLGLNGSDTELIFNVRNAAAHMAMSEATEVRTALTRLSKVALELLGAMGRSEAEFWGTAGAEFVTSLRKAWTDSLDKSVREKFAAAQDRLSERVAGLDARGQAQAIALAEQRGLFEPPEAAGSEYEQVVCPACKRKAVLRYEQVRASTPYLAGSSFIYSLYLFPQSLTCRVCGLDLERDELPLVELGEGRLSGDVHEEPAPADLTGLEYHAVG